MQDTLREQGKADRYRDRQAIVERRKLGIHSTKGELSALDWLTAQHAYASFSAN